jgi:diketogulonate reductase-like aldo/keto reductase
VLQQVARRLNSTPHQVTIAWDIAQASTVFAIPSSRTVEHALDGAKAGDLTLSPEDISAIDQAEFDRS